MNQGGLVGAGGAAGAVAAEFVPVVVDVFVGFVEGDACELTEHGEEAMANLEVVVGGEGADVAAVGCLGEPDAVAVDGVDAVNELEDVGLQLGCFLRHIDGDVAEIELVACPFLGFFDGDVFFVEHIDFGVGADEVVLVEVVEAEHGVSPACGLDEEGVAGEVEGGEGRVVGIVVGEVESELVEVNVFAEKSVEFGHPAAAGGVGEHVDVDGGGGVASGPDFGGAVFAANGVGGTGAVGEGEGYFGCRGDAYPVGPREVMVAGVADAVDALGVGDVVVGAAREDAWGGPSTEFDGSVGNEHVVNHFFAEEEDGVGVGGEGGVFAHIGEEVEELVLSGLYDYFGEGGGSLGEEDGVGGGEGNGGFFVAEVAHGDGIG